MISNLKREYARTTLFEKEAPQMKSRGIKGMVEVEHHTEWSYYLDFNSP